MVVLSHWTMNAPTPPYYDASTPPSRKCGHTALALARCDYGHHQGGGTRPRRRRSDGAPLAAEEVACVKPPQCTRVVNRVPPEILGIIFELCLDQRAPSRAVLSEPPLLLGRVCSYWRSVSQSTPRLWASLSLRFLETNVDRSRDGVKIAVAVETWLHRSSPAPLSINFTDNRIFRKDTESVITWLLSRIRMHAPRWKAIHLKFSSDYFLQLDALSSCAFTSLTSFSVHIDHMGWRRSLLSLRFDLGQATRLTSLAYTGPDHVVREDILLDWARLTSIAFSYDLHEAGGESATLPRHFSALALCQNLTELSIGLNAMLAQGQTVPAAAQIIELPKLHTLRVRRLSRSAHACALLDALRLPQLARLQIDSAALVGWDVSHPPPLSHPDIHPPLVQTQTHVQAHWWHAHHFSSLLDRSRCQLDALHIRDVDVSPLELARLLTSPSTAPTLSAFTFEPCPRTYPIWEVLARFVSTPALDLDSGPSVSATPSPGSSSAPSTSLSPSPSSSSNPASDPGPRSCPDRLPPSFPCLAHLRLGCAHESHLDALADLIESRTGDRAAHAGVRALSAFELVFYDFVYGAGVRDQGRPSRKACFDAFRERVLRCARESGVDVDIWVERPYEPAYLSVP